MTHDELRIVQAHLAQFSNHVCPVCETRSWMPAGVHTMLSYRQATSPGEESAIGDEPGVVPMLIVVCNRCFFVRHFAWLPILREAMARAAMPGPAAEGGGMRG